MIAAISLGGLAFFGLAAAEVTGTGTRWFDGMPPERFRQENSAKVLFVRDVTPVCRQTPPKGLRVIACTVRLRGGETIVVMPHPCDTAHSDRYALIACHELGHVNGWSSEHEE